MATLNIGASTPLEISDDFLKPLQERVASGVDADTVLNDLNTQWQQRINAEGGTNNIQNELGITNTNQFMGLLSGISQQTGGSREALRAYLSGTKAPITYEAGSLQGGGTGTVISTGSGIQPTQADSIRPNAPATTLEQRQQGGTLTAQEMIKNQTAEAEYQKRLGMGQVGQAGQTNQSDMLIEQARQMLQGGQPQTNQPNSVPSTENYTVQSGDSLSAIASRLGVPVSAISGFRSGNPNVIYPGETLTVQKTVPVGTSGGKFSMDQIKQQASLSPEQNVQVEQSRGNIPAPIKTALADKGITADDEALSSFAESNPVKFVTDLYQELYKNSGLSDIKTQFENYTKEVNKITNEMNDKIIDVNDNPWLSETERQRAVAKVKDKYSGRIDSATSKADYMKGLYDSGLAETRFLTQQASTAYNNQIDFQNQLYLQSLEQGYKLAEAQAKAQSPIEVSAGATLFDPTTGQGIFTAPSKATGGGGGGLTPSQINSTVNSIAGAFDNEPTVKEYNTIKRAVDTFNNLGSSATDDIQRVYTFAKIADPNSAVKEGEYASIEKYAQALIQRTGLKVSRVFSATGILTPEARNAMSKTVQTSLNSAQKAYDQVANEYQRQINDAYSGQPRQITNYATGTAGGNQNNSQAPANQTDWATDYNYTRDIEDARRAIQQGADVNAVKQRLLTKYQEVNL